MNVAPGNPGMHDGALVTRTNSWRAQQHAQVDGYETTLPATFDWNVNVQQVRFVTLGQNSTINFPLNARPGATYVLILKQDGTGSRTVTWANQLARDGAGAWKWSGGTAPTLTTTAAKRDVLTFIFDGTDMIGTSVLNF